MLEVKPCFYNRYIDMEVCQNLPQWKRPGKFDFNQMENQ